MRISDVVQTCALPIFTAFIPLMFKPGEAYQFDWSHEDVEIAGKPMRVKVAHMRLRASRAAYVRAYQRGSQEMLDRKRGVSGKSVSVRVDIGGRRIIKRNNGCIDEHTEQQKNNR